MIVKRRIVFIILITYLMLIFAQTAFVGLSYHETFGPIIRADTNDGGSFQFGSSSKPDLILGNNYQSADVVSDQKSIFIDFIIIPAVIFSCNVAIFRYLFNNRQLFLKKNINFIIPVGILAPPLN